MTKESSRAAWRRGGCTACVHFRPPSCSCAAFPAGIPIEVASGGLPHLTPLEGDRGIQFEPRPEPPKATPR